MSEIILAIQGVSPQEAIKIAKSFSGRVWGFKINDLLYEIDVIQELKQYGNVMADAKLYDIPQDTTNYLRRLVNAGADIVTVHCSAFYTPPQDLLKHVVGVTVLTAFNTYRCDRVYRGSVTETVANLIQIAAEFKYPYIVCSGDDLKTLSIEYQLRKNNIQAICPGIRPKWYGKPDDQARTITPKEAVDLGVSYLVIGRPVLNSEDPHKALDLIKEEII